MDEKNYKAFAHTGPGTLAGKYMRNFWHPVHVSHELAPGRAKPIQIMGEPFTLYRAESGKPQVTAFRCAHRGTQLSTGWVEGDAIRCRYHGWKYDSSGQCIEQPGEDQSFADKVKIKACPTREYLGLIFGYFGEGEPPPLPHYPDFEIEGVLVVEGRVRGCNYFNDVENSVDLLHVAFTHRDADIPNYRKSANRQTSERPDGSRTAVIAKERLQVYVPMISAEESAWGVAAWGRLPDGRTRYNQFGMPTMVNFKSPPEVAGTGWSNVMVWRVPATDTSHFNFLVRLVPVTGQEAEKFKEKYQATQNRGGASDDELAMAVLRGELEIKDIDARFDHHLVVHIQDDVTQIGQGAIADRDKDWLGDSDVGVALLRRIWQRELKALAEGRPLKQWHRLPSLQASSGV